MKNLDVIRAWKDEEYRVSLSDAERPLLPAHPAGIIELADTELGHAAGGLTPILIRTCLGLCTWLDCMMKADG